MPVAPLSDVEHARRVLLYGVTGSGKSTAAARLDAALGLPVHLVDDEVEGQLRLLAVDDHDGDAVLVADST